MAEDLLVSDEDIELLRQSFSIVFPDEAPLRQWYIDQALAENTVILLARSTARKSGDSQVEMCLDSLQKMKRTRDAIILSLSGHPGDLTISPGGNLRTISRARGSCRNRRRSR